MNVGALLTLVLKWMQLILLKNQNQKQTNQADIHSFLSHPSPLRSKRNHPAIDENSAKPIQSVNRMVALKVELNRRFLRAASP